MGFTFNTEDGDASAGAQWVTEEGVYHCVVTAMNETPTKRSGDPIPNAAFKATMQVVAGKPSDQVGAYFNLLLFNQGPVEPGKTPWARKKLVRYFLATNLITEAEAAKKNANLSVELQDSVGEQLMVKLEYGKARDDGSPGMLDLSFLHIYHVDDKAVRGWPKSQDYLNRIPAAKRKSPEPAEVTAPFDVDDI